MPRQRKRKSKYLTKRGLPFALMKQVETKSNSVEDADVSMVSGLPIDINLTQIAGGDTVNQRVGNEIKVSSVFFKCGFSNSIDATLPTNKAYFGRVMLWSPRDITASASTPLDAEPFEFPDRQKWIIWADKTVPIPWANSISNSIITIKKRFKPYMKVLYDSSGSGSAIKHPLFITITTNSATALVECSYMSRVYYKDI